MFKKRCLNCGTFEDVHKFSRETDLCLKCIDLYVRQQEQNRRCAEMRKQVDDGLLSLKEFEEEVMSMNLGQPVIIIKGK